MSEQEDQTPVANIPLEHKLLTEVTNAFVSEARKRRKWHMIMFFIILSYIMVSPFIYSTVDDWDTFSEHVAMVDITGVIAEGQRANVDAVKQGLAEAFEDENALGVIVRINSPGGSPVQSDIIHEEILRLRKAYPEKKVYAVVTDICASGGYYIATAADKIYANRSSIIGSIGVRMDSFALKDFINEHNIKRRLFTAGKYKGIMDPFSDLKEAEVTHINTVLDELHQQFISRVEAGRGERLVKQDDLYSGLFWTGVKAKTMGLIDGFGDSGFVARTVFQTEEILNVTHKGSGLDRLFQKIGTSIISMIPSHIIW